MIGWKTCGILTLYTAVLVMDVYEASAHPPSRFNYSSELNAFSEVQASFLYDYPDYRSPGCAYMECIRLIELPDETYYTSKFPASPARLSKKWGIPKKVLLTLNPWMTRGSIIPPGTRVLAYRRDGKIPYSIGNTNHGRIRWGRPMPEGNNNGYFLREYHPNVWGTETTIASLVTAFHYYSVRYPDALPVNIGDISKRRGGKIRPHLSHQSGRDIDVGFVFKYDDSNPRHPQYFVPATPQNLDAEKTWFFIKTLIQTGNVRKVFVDVSVQRMLYDVAVRELTFVQLREIFPFVRHDHRREAIFQHWPGHVNHFHIRFHCPQGQHKCRAK